MKIIKLSVMLFLSLLVLAGCDKKPDKIKSPSFKIDIAVSGGKDEYIVKFTGGILNENNSLALMDIKGTIDFIDPDKGKSTVASIPFELDCILPMSMGIVDLEKKFDENGIKPFIDLFKLNREELDKNKGSEGIFIDDKNISLTISSFRKADIVTLLKGKIDEKI
jgi:hypothetical protein